jgi:hypothetical protein
MSKSTPINRLPMESLNEDFTEGDDSINEVLQEIENQNMGNHNIPLNNNVAPVYNSSIPSMQQSAGNSTYPQSSTQPQQFVPQNVPPGYPQNPNISQEAIEKFLAQNSKQGLSIASFIDMFKNELRLAIAIFVVLFIVNTENFGAFAQKNFNLINIPYFVQIMKALVATILVVVLKKFIS